MSKPKEQHYVPQVYLKAWETTVYSIKEPKKPFLGVYHYDKTQLVTGNGRNRNTILVNHNTYTIDYDHVFISTKCPKIKADMIEQIHSILSQRKIIANYKGNDITKSNEILDYLPDIDDWDFFNLDYSPAKKQANIYSIKEIRSYLLEEKFSSFMETVWENILNTFLSPYPKFDGQGQIDIHYPNKSILSKMLYMVALMMCRNPVFDLYGIFTWLEKDILEPVFLQSLQWDDTKTTQIAINELMRGVWLTEIYKGLFNSKGGFTNTFIKSALEKFGVVMFRTRSKEEGSFITSDNPVVSHFSNVEAVNNNGIYFPLTPEYLLFLGKNSDGVIEDTVFRTVSNHDIKKLNRIILNSSTKSIVSIEKHLGYII